MAENAPTAWVRTGSRDAVGAPREDEVRMIATARLQRAAAAPA